MRWNKILQNLLVSSGIHLKNNKNNQSEFSWTTEVTFSY